MAGVIVTCAVTGSAHTPTMNSDIPVTVDEHVRQSVEAARAGASVIHIHARDPLDGRPVSDPGIFRQYCQGIKEESDAVISITTGGATGQTVEERLRVIERLKPELATCNLGTMNYGLFQMIPRYEGRWKYDWEEPYLESTKWEPFVNTFGDIEYMLTVLVEKTGCRFEFEAYDISHLYTLAYFADLGLVEPPLFVQFVMGTFGGIGPDIENIVAMKTTANRLFGPDLEWSILGGGRFQFDIVTAGATMGGNVRVGLEDGIYLRKGRLAESNAEQVDKIVRILRELSREPATPAETRQRLALKGLNQVAF
ncbi:MAG: 3-keto-5-aminohexanoate cleavage protein [Acidimicrobiia bacterium]|nr:3-keto-5-aminohexanoate cleavage protein [bacterium]MXX64926.1 3-keto-5-aminohexanoate cleavage protein [Acidimicrobiia bacterium]MCY3579142.1 3-keto-5-aminohexanoate cleavage protein [bacterium]MCY3651619.1 3-keto-5-aminohexanoate cleavage protein [bacterium]MDE0643943.1 3-keto-5-aminohexanoate cleavage protein [bacterium]